MSSMEPGTGSEAQEGHCSTDAERLFVSDLRRLKAEVTNMLATQRIAATAVDGLGNSLAVSLGLLASVADLSLPGDVVNGRNESGIRDFDKLLLDVRAGLEASKVRGGSGRSLEQRYDEVSADYGSDLPPFSEEPRSEEPRSPTSPFGGSPNFAPKTLAKPKKIEPVMRPVSDVASQSRKVPGIGDVVRNAHHHYKKPRRFPGALAPDSQIPAISELHSHQDLSVTSALPGNEDFSPNGSQTHARGSMTSYLPGGDSHEGQPNGRFSTSGFSKDGRGSSDLKGSHILREVQACKPRTTALAEQKLECETRAKFSWRAWVKKWNASSEQKILSRIVSHPLFDMTCAVMIVFNSFLIGLGVEYSVDHARQSETLKNMGLACVIFFFLELVIRVAQYGREFLTFFTSPENRGWNLFDTALVVFSIIDLLIEETVGTSEGSAGSLGSAMKTLKMMRIVRVFRVFRFFRELNLLALMIVDSTRSLIWALLMLLIIIYVFAIIFTTAAVDHVKKFGMHDIKGLAEVEQYFGSLARTTYILVQSMLGGISWGIVSDVLLTIDYQMPAWFFFYIAFTMLAVLNIITGVFVDNAVETARMQRDFLVQKETELKERYIVELQNLFSEMDQDKSGSISLDEIQEFIKNPRVVPYFTALGLDMSDAERLFALVDDDQSGDVSTTEFLEGCLRLKGQARSIDVHAVLHGLRKLEGAVATVMQIQQQQLQQSGLSIHSGSMRQQPMPNGGGALSPLSRKEPRSTGMSSISSSHGSVSLNQV